MCSYYNMLAHSDVGVGGASTYIGKIGGLKDDAATNSQS